MPSTRCDRFTMRKAVRKRVEQGLAQLKNVNSLKLSDLGFSRVLMTMSIVIFYTDPPLAPDDVTSKMRRNLAKTIFDVASSGANGGSQSV
ncbi:hypothetical protein PRIPAC_78361 [Pristionchus pacificus]|uniref:Uncharacterized protein n=1 Tax=Pristionchus pacificus TaxID=54126 RepID=A0A2A6CPQ2_PRIPA|nr:hypothetical protein PRIPAC_78361 [Pristionchus pacificus]|eukprot:PDM80174.1 hypothetical protein PRIPAC_32753 [Pristionchus pacificus]